MAKIAQKNSAVVINFLTWGTVISENPIRNNHLEYKLLK